VSVAHSSPSSGDDATDGRRLRSERSRAAVVDALLGLYQDGVLRPGAAEIAARAGVSERSAFRHFEDLDALVEAGIAREFAEIGHLFEPPANHGSRRERIAALIGQRLAIHDAAGAVIRAASFVLPDSARLRASMAERRRVLNRQVVDLFAPELESLDGPQRRELEVALGSVASVEHVEHLRHHLGISAESTRGVLDRTLSGLLATRNRPGRSTGHR
jgi:AcrR family transcriptional regulator